MRDKIEKIITEDVNPYLLIHQGSCEYVSFDESIGLLTVRLKGGCSGCPASHLTLLNGILPILTEKVSEIKEVTLD